MKKLIARKHFDIQQLRLKVVLINTLPCRTLYFIISIFLNRYIDYCTEDKSSKEIEILRKDLMNALKENPDKVKKEAMYRVSLPLMNAHKCHKIDMHCFWEERFKSRIEKRAAVLIKQGLCQRYVLKEMLASYLENEVIPEYDLPKVLLGLFT